MAKEAKSTAAAATPRSTGDDCTVRAYRAGDEARIIELYERTFGRTMGRTESAHHWRWEFTQNPCGKMGILLAESGDTLAAQYAVLPLRVQVGDTLRDGALSLDTATHEGFRGRGLFPRLARQLYGDLAGQGYFAVFGFPNSASAPSFFNKLGWHELAPFPLLVKPLAGAARSVLAARGVPGWLAAAAEPLAGLMRPRPATVPARYRVETANGFPAAADALWQRARVGKRIAVVRDRAYLDWRYVTNPEGGLYRIHLLWEGADLAGYVVTLIEQRFSMRSGFVMDLLFEESRPEVGVALVSVAERTLAADGAQVATALMYPGTEARRVLRAAGFFTVPRRLMPQEIHFGARRLADDTPETLIHDPANWYITWGDTDVV
jgi:hypothetical protein